MNDRRFYILLGVMAILAFAWYQFVSYTQWRAQLVFLADAGVFDFICAGPRHGHFLRYPLAWTADANYFGGHFRPILILIMPFYFISDGMMTYLAFQNAAMVLAAVPLCLYARQLLKSDGLALGVGALYLTNHFVLSIHLANHPESIAFVGFFCLFLAVGKRCLWLYIAGFAWAALVKEDMAIYLGAYGLFLSVTRDPWRRNLGLATMGTAVVLWIVAHLIMHWSGAEALHGEGVKPLSRFASMGANKFEVAGYILSHPFEIAGRIIRPTLFLVFLSTAGLALLDWRAAWLTVMGAGMFLMTDDGMVRELTYYYSYPAIPFLFFSTVRGTAFLLERLAAHPRPARIALGSVYTVVAIVSFLLPTRTDGYSHRPFAIEPHHRLADEIIRTIPPDVSIAAQYDLYSKVPNRPVKLPLRLQNLDLVEYVLFNFSPTGRPADLFGDEKKAEREEVVRRVYSDEFATVFEGDGYFLRRRAPASGAAGEDESPVEEELDDE